MTNPKEEETILINQGKYKTLDLKFKERKKINMHQTGMSFQSFKTDPIKIIKHNNTRKNSGVSVFGLSL